MKNKYGVLGLALSMATASVASENPLIVPGRQVGDIRIGESTESVSRKLKRPTGGDAAMGHQWAFWESKTSRQPNGKPNVLEIYSVLNSRGDKVCTKHIRATSPYFRTKSGISTRSSLAQVKHAFPYVRRTAFYQDSKSTPVVDIYDDVGRGIAFEFIRGGRCLAITVHPTGDTVTNNYLGDHQYHFVK